MERDGVRRCSRAIFAERFPKVVAAYGRRTLGQRAALEMTEAAREATREPTLASGLFMGSLHLGQGLPVQSAEDRAKGDAFLKSFKVQSPLPPESTARLLRVYGTRAPEVLRLASSDDELRQPISDETASVGAEVVFAFRDELAETLVDCLMRRTMTGLNSQLGLDAVERAARVAQRFLGWDESRAAREVENYRRYVERFRP